jgi:hypothetical protein
MQISWAMQGFLGTILVVLIGLIWCLSQRHVTDERWDLVRLTVWLGSGVFAVCYMLWGLWGSLSPSDVASIICGVTALFFIGYIRATIGSRPVAHREEKKRMERLLQAWEDYESGSNRSARPSAKGRGRVPEPRRVVLFLALLLVGIIAVSLVSGVLSRAPEPFKVAGVLGSVLTLLGWSLTLLVVVLIIIARSTRGDRRRSSPRPPRIPGGGGGVSDAWLDGPVRAAVKLRLRRSAASD